MYRTTWNRRPIPNGHWSAENDLCVKRSGDVRGRARLYANVSRKTPLTSPQTHRNEKNVTSRTARDFTDLTPMQNKLANLAACRKRPACELTRRLGRIGLVIYDSFATPTTLWFWAVRDGNSKRSSSPSCVSSSPSGEPVQPEEQNLFVIHWVDFIGRQFKRLSPMENSWCRHGKQVIRAHLDALSLFRRHAAGRLRGIQKANAMFAAAMATIIAPTTVRPCSVGSPTGTYLTFCVIGQASQRR